MRQIETVRQKRGAQVNSIRITDPARKAPQEYYFRIACSKAIPEKNQEMVYSKTFFGKSEDSPQQGCLETDFQTITARSSRNRISRIYMTASFGYRNTQ